MGVVGRHDLNHALRSKLRDVPHISGPDSVGLKSTIRPPNSGSPSLSCPRSFGCYLHPVMVC
jgi:hypothetical protein